MRYEMTHDLNDIRPFAPNHYWYIDDVFIVHETTDGKRYTFFQAEILCSWHRGDDYLSTIPLVWIKCFYPDHPEKEVDFWDENERISFEICKGPPDSFPAITELPEYIQQNIEMTKNSPLLPLNPAIKITLAYRYEKWTYDRTEAWISELKEFFEKVSSMPPRRTRRVSKKSG